MLGKALSLAVAAAAGLGHIAHAEGPALTGRRNRSRGYRERDEARQFAGAKLLRKARAGKLGIARIR